MFLTSRDHKVIHKKGVKTRVIKKIYRWLRGYVLVTLRGSSVERFLNLCNSKDIKIWGLIHKDRSYQCYMMLESYRKMRPIAKKSKVIPLIKERIGFPFVMQQGLRRKGFILGIAMFCAILYILSQYIWDIRIDGGFRYTEDELLKYLQTMEVYSGKKVEEIDCPLIEESIRREYPDIGWVSAEILGTQLIVRIVETSVPALESEKLGTEFTSADIVAVKDAIITSIVTRKGTPKVEIGSIVKAGDVLISGVVPIIGDNDILLENKLVIAEGTIICNTFYNYQDEFSMNYTYKTYTGERKRGFELNAFGSKIFSYSPSNSYEHYDIITEDNVLKLVRNFYLPIGYSKTDYVEFRPHNGTYSNEEAYKIANQRVLKFIEYLKKNGATIVENQVTVSFKNGRCIASGKIIVEEAAWKYEKINDNEWRSTETDELERNDN